MMKYFSIPFLVSSGYLFMFSIFMFFMFSYTLNNTEFIVEWELLKMSSVKLECVFIFDFFSTFFLFLVSLISSSVYLFSVSYMCGEKHLGRFFFLLISFVASMFLLILSPNLISILLGWDGLGVTSYLLVIFYQSSKSYNAGMITALTNRLGDVGILLCVALMFIMGDWNFALVDSSMFMKSSPLLLILILAACTKSAQVPFSAWLPAAMAAPTPVSALVHSSTLVTAGVYLLIRFNNMICSYYYNSFLMAVGCMTMILAGLSAMLEMDMKKIIALSTLSQLGVMMTTLGAQKPLLAYFHLLSHAYFKAMLFMCAGMIIHLMSDYQDIRMMSKSLAYTPLTFSILMVANLSLCGIPFLSGFYSKDMILEMIMLSDYGMYKHLLVWFATFLTVTYSFRLSFLLSKTYSKPESMFYLSDFDLYMNSGMLILMPFAMWGGMFLSWHIFSSPSLILMPFWYKSIIPVLIFSGILYSMFMFNADDVKKSTNLMVFFLSNMWFMPLIFSFPLSKMSMMSSSLGVKVVEMSWLEVIIFYYLSHIIKTLNLVVESHLKVFSFSSIFMLMLFLLLMI